MGLYGEQVLPRLLNVCCNVATARRLRQRVCSGLSGDVVEVGFGSGLNVPFYPAAVTRVHAVEPSDVAWGLARRRIAASPVPVRRCGLDGEKLPLPDGSVDAALSTWTMCTIPDVRTALGELRRVLRPDGQLLFVEHGLAPDASVRRWQRRVEPMQRRVAGGCHLTRPIAVLLQDAGFVVDELDVFYEEGAPKVLGAATLGVVVSP